MIEVESMRQLENAGTVSLDQSSQLPSPSNVQRRYLCQDLRTLSTVTTSTADEDTVSSLSSADERSSINSEEFLGQEAPVSPKPRTIFQCYWEKPGSSPPIPLRPSSPTPSEEDSVASSHCSQCSPSVDDKSEEAKASRASYERTLRKEGVDRRRRSIFGFTPKAPASSSMPLLLLGPASLGQRKARSESDLDPTKLQSCLKNKCQARKRSVSFADEVSIMEFARPQENWAADGWSKWFH